MAKDEAESDSTAIPWQKLASEQKNLVTKLDGDRNILKTINAFALDLIAIPSKEDLAWYLAREVVGKMGFVDCVVYFVDDDKKLLRQHAAIGSAKNPASNEITNILEIPLGEGITGHVAQTKKPQIVDDLEKDSRYIPDVKLARSEICVPLMIDGRVVGVIDCEDPRPGHFNEFHLETLTTVAAMTSARLKLIEQDQTLERESEAKYREIFGSSNVGLALCKMDGTLVECNQAYLDIIGYTIDEAKKLTYWDLTPRMFEEDESRQLDSLKEFGRYGPYEKHYIRKTGERIPVLLNGTLLIGADGHEYIWSIVLDISERKAAVEKLKERDALFSTVLGASPNILIVTQVSDGRIRYCNDAMTDVLGYQLDAVIGHEALDFYHDPRDREAFLRKFQEGGVVRNHEVRLKKADGTSIWTLINAKITDVYDEPHMVAEIMDLTERKAVEKKMKETQDHIQSVLDASPAGFVISHPESGTIEYANTQLAAIMRLPMDKFIGMPASDFYDNAADRDAIIKLIQREGSVTNYQVLFRRADGATFWGLMTLKSTMYQGNQRYFTWIHDVSELKKALEEAENANLAKSEFLSSMSHELRTPMNAILGFAQLLEFNPLEPLSDKQKSSVDLIIKGGNHLLALIEQVLELSKIEAGYLSLNVDHIAARKIIDESLSLIRTRADQEDVEILDQTSGADLPMLWTDATRLEQVLLNLLSNAVKYNRKGGTVTLSCLKMPNEMLRISVADTGRGIPLEKQKDLFKPFERLGRESGTIEGTGIGLTITKQIIELLGGQVGFVSEEERGCTFYVDIPISEKHDVDLADPEIAKPSGKAANKPNENGSRYSVLYVEDNPDNMKLMEALIGQVANTRLLTAYNAELGLDLAKSERPDLILMDINLPGMNGIEALKQLQDTIETKNIPVIAITAAAMPRDIEEGLKAGFRNYITKPFNVREIIRTIEETLNNIDKST